MKRKLLIVASLLISYSTINAQGVLEAHKYSQTELRGTARSMSMGGAFGALGGDITAISINPAGIGVYKSSEIVATLDLQNVETKTSFQNFNTGTIKNKKFNANFNNFAFVGTFPLYNDVAPLINFGFSYNKVKSFDRKYTMAGEGLSSSLTDYIAARANGGGYTGGDLGMDGTSLNERDNMWRYDDWLPLLGYNGFLIDYEDEKFISSTQWKESDGTMKSLPLTNDLYVKEKGSINTYDFNVGTTFEDMISAGLTVSVTDIDYKMTSTYKEDFYSGTGSGGYDLHNSLRTEGSGWQLGLGVIFKPIQELRIGVAYHSPTWYRMTDHFYSDLYHNFEGIASHPNLRFPNDYTAGGVESMDGDLSSRTDYKLRTPDKWTFSLASVIGKNAIISLDYDLVDYAKSRFHDRDGRDINNDLGLNRDIKNTYKLTSTLRVGGEYRFTPQFSGRLGYSWQQDPYSSEFKDFINPKTNPDQYFDTPGAVSHYVIEGATNYYTWGLGYRFSRNFYTDLAFVYKTQNADLYTHSLSDLTKLKHNTFQGTLTLGFRF